MDVPPGALPPRAVGPARARRRLTGLLAVLVLSIPGAAISTAPVSAAVTPLQVLTWWGPTDSSSWTGGEVTVQVSPPGQREVVTATGGGDVGLELTLMASLADGRLSVGRHTFARDDWDGPLVNPSYRNVACSGRSGWFQVLDLSRDLSGRLSSLAVDWGTDCPVPETPAYGSLRWQSSAAWTHTSTEPLVAPPSAPGVTRRETVTVLNSGTTAQTYGPTTWRPGGTHADEQAPALIDDDRCAGRTLAPGASCTLEVVLPAAAGTIRGNLVTPDGTLGGRTLTPVFMQVVAPPQPFTLTASAERGSVLLHHVHGSQDTYRILRSTWSGAAQGPETVVAETVTLGWRDTAVEVGTTYTYRAIAMRGGIELPPSNAVAVGVLPVVVGQAGTFVPVDPVRVLDTRTGLGGRTGKLAQQQSVTLDPGLGGAVPRSGVSAVLLNVTGTEPSQPTHVRVWPAGTPMPGTSSLNLLQGQDRANQVIVPVGHDGRVSLYNNTGSTHLVVDVQGYYSTADGTPGGGYHPVEPERVLDTRNGDPVGAGRTQLVPVHGESMYMDVSSVVAVAVNLTVTEPTTRGHVTAWPGDVDVPTASTLNFAPGQTVPNHAVVPVAFDARGEPFIAVRNSNGRTHVVVDVLGWYDDGVSRDDGLRFTPSVPTRLEDSRLDAARIGSGQTLWLQRTLMPPAVAHVVNVTATGSVGPGHLTAWSGDGTYPSTSTVNYATAEDSPNLATVQVGGDGGLAITANSSPAHIVVDHLGYFW